MLPPPLAAAEAVPLQQENELLLELRLDGEPLEREVLGYQRDDHVLVSLGELADGLELPINVDAVQGRAEGWFIAPGRTFALDLNRREVVSGGETYRIGDGEVVVQAGDLFVQTEVLGRWLPITLEPLVRQLALNVLPRETLPLQARLTRRRHTSTARFDLQSAPELPLQPTPYRFIGPHTTDIRLGYATVRPNADAETDYSANYALLSRGDLGWMTSTLSLSGHDDDRLNAGRLMLERTAFDGPLALNHVEAGDISTGSRGLLIRGGGVRGGLDGRFADETIDLQGAALPDWEVELYRNGLLLATQVVGQDGQYRFENVPLEFGENRFEFVLYGPFGEESRTEEMHYLGPDMLTPGRVSYTLAAVESGRTVFGLQPGSGKGDVGTEQYLANVNLGLARGLTTGLGVETFERDGERIEYYDAGFGLAFSNVYGSTRYGWRPDSLDLWTTSLRSRIFGSNVNLGYTHYYANDLDDADIPDNRNLWQANLGITAHPFTIPINFTALHTEQERSGFTQAALGTTFRLGKNGRFSTTVLYAREARDDLEPHAVEVFDGATSLATTLRPWRFRLGATYGLSPETELRILNSSAALRLDRTMTMNLELQQDVATDLTTYRAGFNWLLDEVQISPRLTYDSNERWAGLISLSTTLTPRRGSLIPWFDSTASVNTGNVEARVFIDPDGTGEFGPHAIPLEGVRVDAVHAWQQADTDHTGSAHLGKLSPYRQTDVAIVLSSVEEQELRPVHEGRSVIPRPGSHAVIDFPMIRTMELEGHVHTRGPGGLAPEARVVVALVDEHGKTISRQRTAFDGFFLFSGIASGQYQLRLEGPAAERVAEQPGTIRVGGNGGVLPGLDFLLHSAPGRSLRAQMASAPRPLALGAEEAAGPWHVQLGAFGARANAESHWSRLHRRMPAVLGPYKPQFETRGNLTRLYTTPGQTREAAARLCQAVKARGYDCLLRQLAAGK